MGRVPPSAKSLSPPVKEPVERSGAFVAVENVVHHHVDFTGAKCCHCQWWRPHSPGTTGNCIARPPFLPIHVASQAPVYYSQDIPLCVRGSQFCVHPTTAAAEVCRLFQPKEAVS